MSYALPILFRGPGPVILDGGLGAIRWQRACC